jgi:cell wall-associated protease
MTRRPIALTLGLTLVLALSAPTSAGVASGVAAEGDPSPGLIVAFEGRRVSLADFDELALDGIAAGDIEVGRAGLIRVDVTDDEDASALARAVRDNPRVRAAVPDAPLTLLGTVPPSDHYYETPRYTSPYDVYQRRYLGPDHVFTHSVQTERLWAVADGGEVAPVPVRMALVDTGYEAPSSDGAGVFVDGWDYVNDDPDPTDDHGHGTGVGTVIASATDNGIGIAGAAYDLVDRIVVYKVMDEHGNGTSFDAMTAIMDAADAGAQIINCSFGATAYDGGLIDMWNDTVAYAYDQGALVVGSSGNGGADGMGDPALLYPARSPGALGVGSISYDTGVASRFSNYGPDLDVVAPGELILRLDAGSTAVRTGSGTSYSAPVASGSLAVLWALVPDATVQDVLDAVENSADPYPPSSPDTYRYGSGKLDVFGAYQQLATWTASEPEVVRLAGADRYGTAAEVSASTFTTAPAVVLASGRDFADALSASVLAAQVGGPLLLSDPDRLPAPVAEELGRLFPGEVIIMGGEEAVSAAVENAVDSLLPHATVGRIAGVDRYDTAALTAIEAATRAGSTPEAVVIASGIDFPDALSATPLASGAGYPILLTDPDAPPARTLEALVDLDPSTLLVVGGPGAVSQTVVDMVTAAMGPKPPSVERIAGVDRYATSRALAEFAADEGVLGFGELGVATGLDYPDALAGGVLLGRHGAPLILADEMSSDLDAWLGERAVYVDRLWAFGGDSAMSDELVSQMAQALVAY